MILSVSRRTDIPAFYSEWFFNRIKAGFVLTRNPLNAKQVSKIDLSPEFIDCIVFWTKNPQPMLKRLHLLEQYRFYYQFTLNCYDKSIETKVPAKRHLIETFQELSRLIGKQKLVWRYDPILLTDTFDKKYHYKWFEYLVQRLHPYTEKCMISFLDLYSKTERNLKGMGLKELSDREILDIAGQLSIIADRYGLPLETCAESINLSKFHISHGKCIDDRLITKILGEKLDTGQDPNQRKACGCVKSIDIGEYNTCRHNCLYCYANFNKNMVSKNIQRHNTKAPLLIGQLAEDAKVTERLMQSYRTRQPNLFDE
ncbi:MAG: DUF1848 domain-containing protein [Peptococcaceae bacterium]